MRRAIGAWLWGLGLLLPAACAAPAALKPGPLPLAACEAGDAVTFLPTAAQAVAARAVWLDGRTLRWPGIAATGPFRLYASGRGQLVAQVGQQVQGADELLELDVRTEAIPAALAERFKYVAAGVTLSVRAADAARVAGLLRSQLLLVREDGSGIARDVSALQVAGALDDLYAPALAVDDLGAKATFKRTAFKLWAPTATRVSLCLYRTDAGPPDALEPLRRDPATGVWSAERAADLSGWYYRYLVDVYVPGTGYVRNRVTDPYARSLGADSRRSYVANLDAPSLKPAGWDDTPSPQRVQAQTDLVVYELHVRDFSAGDATVPVAHRGKYLAFTDADSDGMRHLKALAAAGVTDLHLLPVFDIATIPETGCVEPAPQGPPDGTQQQATVAASKAADCYNWGYDPFHYSAPEGSYATDASDGAVRVLEFRRMVQALHQAGLRVGMDVVYNHTSAAGQSPKSVLDRVVPGYYHRLDANGAVTNSTCCANTATENAMMAKLMSDSVLGWARDYKLDSFRFDLMGHQPRAAMEALRARVNAVVGREVPLIGEGWNFGEVQDGARFVQASQRSLNGSHIATFNDRLRDSARGGGCCDNGDAQVKNQGFVNGLVYDRNSLAPSSSPNELMRIADLVRAGLAGTLRDYPLRTYTDQVRPLAELDYFGQPAGYASQPDEVVNYVENHDNQTLYDLDAFKLPLATSRADRARVQVCGAALVLFAQGLAYVHAGQDLLRSKSMDRNSFDSGDWFNRVDWRGVDSTFGSGLPPEGDNGSSWSLMGPLLANAALKPTSTEIQWTGAAFLDLLRIRSSSTLFRLRTADEVKARLAFANTGPSQAPTVIAAHLDGNGYDGAGFEELVYFVNVDKQAHELTLAAEQGKAYVLHPVQRAAGAADTRARDESHYDAATGRFTIPARTAVVYVVE